MTEPVKAAARRSPGRPALLLGVGCAIFGVLAYIVQVSLQNLSAPWYMPCLATLGAALVGVALWWRRTAVRIVAIVLVTLLACAEWAFLFAVRLPPYTGPIAVGRPFPAFTTTRADGSPFTQSDLRDAQNTVLVFFRGRW
jgi:hypothetical protein